MRKRAKEPQVPPDRQDTLRHAIVALLADETLTANEISGRVGISEKEVLDHLEHVKIALHGALVVVPPLCLECGFSFRKRERLRKPGRCPVCRSEHIVDPSFTVGHA